MSKENQPTKPTQPKKAPAKVKVRALGSIVDVADPLRFEKTPVAGGVLVRLVGVLDADLDAQALVAGLEGQCVVLDMDGVRRTTSFGVREWVSAMHSMRAASVLFI